MSNKLGLNPWTSMWRRPRETIRAIISTNPSHGFVWLSGIYGLNYVLGYMMILSLGLHYPLWMLLAGAALLSIPVGMIILTIFSGLTFILGKLLGGKGTFKEVRASVMWASVGYLPILFTWLVSFFVFGQGSLVEGYISATAMGSTMVIAQLLYLIDIVAFVWIVVMFVKGLGEAQKFSAWMGLLNLVLVVMVIGALKWVLMQF